MSEDESDVGLIVRTARTKKGMSQAQLAKNVGTDQQTIGKIEKGLIKHSSYLPAIAQELSIAVERVVRNAKAPSTVEHIPGSQLFGERDLKVYAAVQGGPGAMILSNEPVDYVLRPEPLARVKDGYGVIVIGESMAPAIEPGDIVCVNKHLPPRPGDDCVFQYEAPDGNWHASVKRLRRTTENAWLVTEWNSEKGGARDFSMKRAEWRDCHVVVAIYKRR